MKKSNTFLTLGILISIAMFISFAKNIRVTGWHFYHIGGINMVGVLSILLIADIVWLVVKPNKIAKYIAVAIGILFIITAILGVRLYLARMSFIKFIAMLLMLALGIGLTIKGAIEKKKE